MLTDLRRLGGPPVGTDQGAGDTGARSEEHLQREGDSLLRGGPFGGYAMRRGDTGARSANITSIITSTSSNLCCA